ncbi:TPA_asm: 4'-phosphopantetheinyl transferase superfamily protein [Salmonella enterica]|nr:4-phosphopantetheinyl transferase [Salmonella enterica]EAO7618971.1 4-phosphopantetheinyl transferase [Salmonella enterica]EAQ6819560.1 4-phosphopantetheinyl transferase [Salmonella enterica]EAU9427143.1 4'-phosphopantetheinyl transferase superfamily protein [Salmonella enterica]EBQ2131095.1 4'-phosphopantetheinyl transferase superfamily protein [Salmonella enterica]
MFTSITTGSTPPFIRHFDMGWINPFPSLSYCLVTFSVHHYQDRLFEEFDIPFPCQLKMAVVKRKAEYLAARYAAQRVLLAGGCDRIPTTSSDRSPIWPPGWCGSLSHTHEYAVAVVSPSESNLTPGIDIEVSSPDIMQKTAHIFACTDELDLFVTSDISYATALLVAFSAKESLFKALYPEVGRFFNFDVAKVCEIEPLNQEITMELTQTLTPNRVKGLKIKGYYFFLNGKVITLVA